MTSMTKNRSTPSSKPFPLFCFACYIHGNHRQNRLFNGYKELIRFIPAFRKPLMEGGHDELVEIIGTVSGYLFLIPPAHLPAAAPRGSQRTLGRYQESEVGRLPVAAEGAPRDGRFGPRLAR